MGFTLNDDYILGSDIDKTISWYIIKSKQVSELDFLTIWILKVKCCMWKVTRWALGFNAKGNKKTFLFVWFIIHIMYHLHEFVCRMQQKEVRNYQWKMTKKKCLWWE